MILDYATQRWTAIGMGSVTVERLQVATPTRWPPISFARDTARITAYRT